MIGTRYRHMTEAMQARVVAAIAERLAVASQPLAPQHASMRSLISVLLSTQITLKRHNAG